MHYKWGADAGREGRDPKPPERGIIDELLSTPQEAIDRAAADYRAGYASGSTQRVADELAEDDED